ncbi:hypothetical protein GS982_01575 [Rhodococcus hoagii]|uniref:Uncharacterized protein n=1 Tax=Rhodococcus hoagii TaxID=43767 RepID=A0A9Q4ZIQ9_RHOHA|nr:hypothetical protein [Prescottella equi]NKT77287.1 hypothetical protein [Prescottella equi]NKZ81074.1 hypothetical protein [Prescottella equi]
MTDNTIAGRPINGEISHYSSKEICEQRPIQEFLDALDALFAFPEVEAVRWEQYTPYFNDGDACEFGIREVRIKFVGGDEEAGEREDGFIESGLDFPPGYFDTHSYGDYKYYAADGTEVDANKRWGMRGVTSKHVFPEGKARATYTDMKFYVNGEVREDIEKAYGDFARRVGGAHEIDLRKHFGDPAQVTATREGFDVEFYEHE